MISLGQDYKTDRDILVKLIGLEVTLTMDYGSEYERDHIRGRIDDVGERKVYLTPWYKAEKKKEWVNLDCISEITLSFYLNKP